MALDVGGRHDEAARGVRVAARACSAPTARGTRTTVGNEIKDPTLDTNVTCYVATGVWHHYLVTGDTAFLDELWPAVEPAIDFALDYQREIGRDRVARRRPRRRRAAHRLVEHPREPAVRDRDRRAARSRAPRLGALARLARHRRRAPARRVPRQGPLGDGLVLPDPRRRAARPRRARARRRRLGATFVVEGRGVRCVSDRPWVTAAETCELVMALDAIGADEHARRLFAWVQFLRADGGGYWTGANFDDERFHRRRRALPRRAAHLELRRGRARGERARRHRPDRGPVPRRGPARRASTPTS